MRKNSFLVLGLLGAIVGSGSVLVGCGGSDGGAQVASAGSSGHAGTVSAAGSGVGGMSPAMAGSAGSGASAGSAEMGGATSNGGSGGSGGSGGTCDVPSLEVFNRSDTAQSWDDNDFSDVVFNTDVTCPKQFTVTWPHESGWEHADPAESNHEVTHFTIDSYSSMDLTNKKLSLTIELTADQRDALATAGSYNVSLVSVSTYDRVASSGGAGGMDAAGSGTGGASGGASGGGDSTGGTSAGGAAVATETGYAEAELAATERATLRYVGDRATVEFKLPNKTSAVDSYDPMRVIKINLRIYNAFSDGQTAGMGGAGGMSSVGGAGGSNSVGGSDSVGGSSGSGGTPETAGVGGSSAGASAGSGGAPPGASGSGGAGGGAPAPVYGYLTSTFAISNFSIKDAP